MTWFYASSVSVANGQTVVSVNAGDDIQLAQSAGGLIIGTQPAVEIKRTFLDASSNKKIELTKPWPYGTQTNQPAMAFPTDGDLAAATAVLKQLIDGFTLATQAEAQAGTDNTKPMTALRVKQAMDTLLGTASKLTATTGVFDAVVGRALRVGDFGIASSSVTVADLKTVVPSGLYRQEDPEHGIAYTTTLHTNSGDGRQQLTLGRAGYRMAFRGSPFGANGTGDPGQYWSPWAEVFHNYNVVGPVFFDTLKNVPTGGVIERGANASGEFVKFADGTVFAWGRVVSSGITINPASTGNSNTGYLCDPVMPTTLIGRVLTLGQHALYDSSDRLIYSVTAAGGAGLPMLLNLGTRPDASWPYLNVIGSAVAVKVDYSWVAVGRWR